MPRDCTDERFTLDPPDYSSGVIAARNDGAAEPEGRRIAGVVIGTVVGLGPAGEIRVDYPGNPTREALAAVATARVASADVGRPAALLFENGDPARPILVGLIESLPTGEPNAAPERRLVLEAAEELVLKSGKASITLTKAGKILLRGSYVSSRSSGVNRIKGGSVQIN